MGGMPVALHPSSLWKKPRQRLSMGRFEIALKAGLETARASESDLSDERACFYTVKAISRLEKETILCRP